MPKYRSTIVIYVYTSIFIQNELNFDVEWKVIFMLQELASVNSYKSGGVSSWEQNWASSDFRWR